MKKAEDSGTTVGEEQMGLRGKEGQRGADMQASRNMITAREGDRADLQLVPWQPPASA